ncbi:MAG: hypothetical protein ACE5JM_17920, partial [Armatimonadota bacterium]
FVMWNGRNTVHFRRCDMHHLWADWGENPGFIFTFAGDRRGDSRAYGVRPSVDAYHNFVIQDNYFHDRFMVGNHGGAFVFYTVHDSLVEDNVFERIEHGACFWDKDNGLGNTYRGNVIRGNCGILGQWCNEETEISHNYIEGNLVIGRATGWLRNIWIHHNTIRGSLSFTCPITKVPEALDESTGDFSQSTTADSARAIREFPIGRRLVHFYRNVIDAPAGDTRTANVITRIPHDKAFAERWRYLRWDENVVDSDAQIIIRNRRLDFSILKACGFDANGLQAPVTLTPEGDLPAGSLWAGQYGR